MTPEQRLQELEQLWKRHKRVIRAAYELMESARPLVLLLESLKDADAELNPPRKKGEGLG